MNVPLITWCMVVALLVVLLLGVLMRYVRKIGFKNHFIQIGSECEEFYVPGDLLHPEEGDDYD